MAVLFTMPGLTVVSGDFADEAHLLQALKKVTRDIESLEVLFFRPRRAAILWVAHESHPRRVVRTELGLAVLEGTVPGQDGPSIDSQLQNLIASVHDDESRGRSSVIEWASRADGDFVLVLLSYRSSSMLIINDVLGRLPLYKYESSHLVIVSREVKVPVALAGAGSVNRSAISQVLLFGFPLGQQTLVREINAIPPATSITINTAATSCRVSQYRTWNFEEVVRPNSERVSVSELAQLFESVCSAQARVNGFSGALLELSGGLDSRSVAAALDKSGTPFTTATYRTFDGAYDKDVPPAREVAMALKVPWRLYPMSDPTWEALVEVSLLRDGLNYSGMAPRLEYLRQLRRDYGTRVVCFTGDGGDRVLWDLRAPWWVRDLRHYVDFRLQGTILGLDAVASLLGLRPEHIRNEIRDYLASYPEQDMRNREVHFLIMEKARRWLLEGEERNRSYVWQQTPFYGHRFFECAMAFHPNEKRNYKLYQAFLSTLNPRLAKIPNARWAAPLGSMRAARYQFKDSLFQDIPPTLRAPLRTVLRRVIAKKQSHREIAPAITEQAAHLLGNKSVSEVFRTRELNVLLQTCNDMQFYYLATQLIYVANTWK